MKIHILFFIISIALNNHFLASLVMPKTTQLVCFGATSGYVEGLLQALHFAHRNYFLEVLGGLYGMLRIEARLAVFQDKCPLIH